MGAQNFDVFVGNQCDVEAKQRRKKKHRKRLISGLLFMFCECVRLSKNDEAKAENLRKMPSSKAGKNSTFQLLITIIAAFHIMYTVCRRIYAGTECPLEYWLCNVTHARQSLCFTT